LPTLATAIPDPRSISELPSTSTSTPPPAAVMKTGRVVPTPSATVAARRAISSRDRGPGISVTRRRSWGSSGPPMRTSGAVSMLIPHARRSGSLPSSGLQVPGVLVLAWRWGGGVVRALGGARMTHQVRPHRVAQERGLDHPASARPPSSGAKAGARPPRVSTSRDRVAQKGADMPMAIPTWQHSPIWWHHSRKPAPDGTLDRRVAHSRIAAPVAPARFHGMHHSSSEPRMAHCLHRMQHPRPQPNQDAAAPTTMRNSVDRG
jgi:hypothetical protein